MMQRFLFLAVWGLLLAACSPTGGDEPTAESPPVPTIAPTAPTAVSQASPPPTATDVPTAVPDPPTPTPIPTDEPTPTEPEPEVAADTPTPEALYTYGRTDEGVFFRGNPNAEVTLIDYSDFL